MSDSELVSRLSNWSSMTSPLAPLSTDQLDLLTDLGEIVRDRPLPSHIIQARTNGHSLYEASSTASVRSGGTGEGEDQAVGELFPAFSKLEMGSTKIDTGQQFLQWLHQVEGSLIAEQDLPYRRYIGELERQLEVTSGLEKEVGESLAILESLSSQYCMVSEKTTSLHTACQHLLEEQTRLAMVDRELQDRLTVFQQADKVSHKLTSPTLSVHSETFLPLLTTIDTSLKYLEQHRDYKETPAYLTKFRACLSRALEMVRTYVRRVLESATGAASSQPALLGETEGTNNLATPHSAFTLFYGKFRAAAPRVRPLIQEAERRGEGGMVEYTSLVSDLEQFYLECRLGLLQPSVKSAVHQLLTVHTRDHTGLVRAGCAFLLHVCEDEFQLHSQFFSGREEAGREEEMSQLASFLEQLCLVLYDSLRPLIIHVTHLETLAELTSILRNEVVGQHCLAHPQLEAFRRVASQMLQDVQERLVYRTSVYIRTDIQGYSPAPGDLAYPEKLEMMEQIAEQLQQQREQRTHSRQNSSSSIVSVTSMEVGTITGKSYSGNSPADMHGMWFPPVRRTLLTLSKLYRCLERSIFTGLSQEVLSACLDSVSAAANSISTNQSKSRADGQLFEIKHLLILREQIAPFQVDFSVRETSLDFGKIKNAAMSLLNHRAEILSIGGNNALLEFLLDSSPGVQEHLRDSKKEVDRRLKLTCEQFINDTSGSILELVHSFNNKAAQFSKVRGDRNSRVAAQPWGGTETIRNIVAETVRRVKNQVPLVQRKMQLYLANRETEFILFRPVRSNILSAFVTLLATLRAEYSFDEQTIIGCPSQEQLAATLASVMVVHVSGVSSVSRQSSLSSSRQGSQSPELARKISVNKTVKFSQETVMETKNEADDNEKENPRDDKENLRDESNGVDLINGNGVENNS